MSFFLSRFIAHFFRCGIKDMDELTNLDADVLKIFFDRFMFDNNNPKKIDSPEFIV